MPAIAAAGWAARQAVIIGVQLGIFWAIDRFVTPHINQAIKSLMVSFGVSEETASDIMANEVIVFIESLGLTVLAAKAKMPLAIADKLGFTTKGTKLRKLPAQVEAQVAKAKGTAKVAAPTTADAVSATAKTVSTARGISLEKVSQASSVIIAGFGVPVGIGLLITNTIDFAAWNSSAYQGTFQKMFAVVGMTPDRQMISSRVLSQEVWDKVYNVYKTSGAVGISDPFKLQTVLFTPQTLVDIVDKIAAGILLETGGATAKQVLGATTQAIILRPDSNSSTSAPVSSPTQPAQSGSSSGAAPVQQIQLYTGIVASGTLGTPSEFIARPDDMINNTSELKEAAKINLAAFVTGLPGKFFYEVAIVNTVKSQAGFTQKGDAVRIVSSYNKDGTPRYKTVYHKFAVMRVGVIGENAKPVKLGTITLGPVNVVDFQPTNGDLQNIAGTISGELFTSNIGDIKQINSSAGVKVDTGPTPPPPVPGTPPVTAQPTPSATVRYRVTTGGINLNLRAEADLQAGILDKIPDGTLLVLDPNSGDHQQDGYTWHITSYNGTTGYVAREYLIAEAYTPPAAPASSQSSSQGQSSTPTGSTSTKKEESAPKPKTDSLGLTSKQRKQYDQLIAAGASKSAALKAAKLVPN